jgi:hypothetical protein
MFDFMYLHTYGDPTSSSDNDPLVGGQELCLHANVYALGEKYGIAALEEASLQKFEESAQTSWKSSSFRDAVKIVFTSTADHDKSLRDVVFRILFLHRKELAGDTQMETVIHEIDGLAYGLWKMISVLPRGPTCNACQSVYVSVCREPHRRSTKSASADGCFVSCHCDQEHFCGSHRDSGGVLQEEVWS